MESIDSYVPDSSRRDHERTTTSESLSQATPELQNQSICEPSPSSHSSQGPRTSKKTFISQSVEETSDTFDDGEVPHAVSKVNETNDCTSGETTRRSSVGIAARHDPETGTAEDQESGLADLSDTFDSNSMDACDESQARTAEDQGPECADESESFSSDLMDTSNDDPDNLSSEAEEMGAEDSSRWCSVCRHVAKCMIKGKVCPPLGTWKDLQSRAGCPSCDDMLSLASRFEPMQSDEQLTNFRLGSGLGCSYIFRKPRYNPAIWMAPCNRVIESDRMGVAMDPNWIDITRLRQWLTFCDQNHGDTCHGLPVMQSFSPTTPRYLIDVEQGCLIESQGGERYFALSYVWGDQQTDGKATKSNIELLKGKGTISVRNATLKLPQTIVDTMQLTTMLGERFLWIDRLCIIQDDKDNWHSQIQMMGSIYANAYCTFIASCGKDADHGIPGLNQISGPRQMSPRTTIHFPSLQMIEVDPVYSAQNSTWNSRGWTFQELKLSRRALFFDKDVRWICQRSKWQEDSTAEPEGAPSRLLHKSGFPSLLNLEPWPDFVQWGHLIEDYCQREFKFEGEAGAGFAGIEEILSHSFPGGFCFGLPEFFFDIAMLWRPLSPLRRRVSQCDVPADLPSWSFLGWKEGSLCGPSNVRFACEWISTGGGIFPCSTSSIVPMVEWIQKGPSGQERRIRNDYHLWKTLQDQQLPEDHARLGWQNNGGHWTHPRIRNRHFRYPVPLGFQMVDVSYRTWSSTLRLRSQSTVLTVSIVLDVKGAQGMCFCVELVTHRKEWAGLLYLNTNNEESIPTGKTCELVCLSYGSVSNDDIYAHYQLDEWYSGRRPRDSEIYEFYNVMWIRRQDAYVVREGIGRVEKSVWDSQELEDIDVELR